MSSGDLSEQDRLSLLGELIELRQRVTLSDNRIAELEQMNERLSREYQEILAQRKKLEAREAELELLINTNPSTGLPIRRVFERDLERLLGEMETKDRGPRIAVGILRLDDAYVKIKNSRDKSYILLTKTAERIKSRLGDNVYQSDRLDEFLLIFRDLPNLDAVGFDSDDDVGFQVVQDIVDEISQPHDPPADDIAFGCYLGISVYPHDGKTKERLMSKSNIALSESERLKEGYIRYRDAIGDVYSAKANMESELKLAIQRGRFDDQFSLRYQPFVDANHKIVGSEALVRWLSPVSGEIPPDRFIPVAEETGTIRFLDLWTLYRASRQLKAWHVEGYTDLHVSVNVSPSQFKNKDLVEQVSGVLKYVALDGKYLKMELTEGDVMDEPEDAIAKMNELRSLGISLSLDDFGTGYSSLSYLRRFPIETLKIDRSFITGLHENKVNQAIVRAMIAMAQGFGMCTLAEGVEEEPELNTLLEYGCDYIQGFYFSPPVRDGEFGSLLADGWKHLAQT